MSARSADADVQAALALSAELPAAPDPVALRRRAVELVAALLHADVACWYDLERRSGRLRAISSPAPAATDAFVTAAAEGAQDHPMVARHLDGPGPEALVLSDFLSDRRVARSRIAPAFALLGVRREAAIAVPTPEGLFCVAVYRARRDFDARDRARLALLRSALATAERLAGVRASAELDALTPREREVLDALAAGETATQAARRLGISPRTVHKHLEHLYRKLGVSHAGAAAALHRTVRGER